MNQLQAKPLALVMGTRLREVREAANKRQEDVAVVARKLGLDWTRVTVAAIELGRRRLSLEELLLLPYVFNDPDLQKDPKGQAQGRFLELPDFFPRDDWIVLSPETRVRGRAVRKFLRGHAGNVDAADLDLPIMREAAEIVPVLLETLQQMAD